VTDSGSMFAHTMQEAVKSTPNNSLMLTRLAGEKGGVLCPPHGRRENGAGPEPPGSIARGR